MDDILKWISPYELRARTLPGMLLLLPLFALCFALLPLLHAAAPAFGAAAAWVISAYMVGQWMRDRAEPHQKSLWASWGAAPTTLMLRWSNPEISKHEKAFARSSVLSLGEFRWPDEAEEAADPSDADAHYGVLVKAILSDARRHPDRYERQDRASAHYGFQRNCYYSKNIGITLAISSALLAGAAMFFSSLVIDWRLIALVDAICVAVLIFWIYGISEERLRRSANAFAVEVFRHIPVLVESKKSTSP